VDLRTCTKIVLHDAAAKIPNAKLNTKEKRGKLKKLFSLILSPFFSFLWRLLFGVFFARR
jgi:hypothetical protein